MTGDVFRRFALVVGCSTWAVAVAVVWQQLGWQAAAAAIFVGPVGAILLSFESRPAPAARKTPAVGRGHRELARIARLAAGRDDD